MWDNTNTDLKNELVEYECYECDGVFHREIPKIINNLVTRCERCGKLSAIPLKVERMVEHMDINLDDHMVKVNG